MRVLTPLLLLLGAADAAKTLHPSLCTQRFWRARYASYCAHITPEAAWASSAADAPLVTAQEPLDVFSVDRPVRVAGRATGAECTSQQLMQHTFGFSYGQPFVGNYTPPACEWTNVVFTLSMTSAGRQYDRLALMFLGDTEVWRTSTAEPTSYGIVFSYTRDMTRYAALLRQPQKIVFDLGNLVNDVYTGSFNATLTATFYNPAPANPILPAHAILPVSAGRAAEGQPSHWRLPADGPARRALVIPRNTARAVVSVSATGSEAEEFWYTNVPSAYTATWPNSSTTLYGYGAFREVQVLIDGALVGVAWPQVAIYTGGVSPSLWRPIVDLAAYDLPEYEIDISPWLGVLADDAEHTVEIVVASYDETARALVSAIGDAWLVSGRVFLWHGEAPVAAGVRPKVVAPAPTVRYSPPVLDATNSTLTYALRVARSISATAADAAWVQNLDYTFTTTLTNSGDVQTVSSSTSTNDATRQSARRRQGPLVIEQAIDWSQDPGVITAFVEHGLGVYGVDAFSAGAGGAKGNDDAVLRGNATWTLGRGGDGRTRVERMWKGTRENAEGVQSWARIVEGWCGLEGAAGVDFDKQVVDGVVVA